MSIPIFYLVDSSDQVWQLGVTDLGAYTTTFVSGPTGAPYFPLQDITTGQIWKLSVLTSGALYIVPTFGVSTTGLLIKSPSSLYYYLFINNSAISTLFNVLPIVQDGAFQDPLGNPIANGVVTFQLSQPAISSTGLLSTTIINELLDSSGNIIPVPLWPNSLLTPSTTFYYVKVYTSSGHLVWYSPIVIPNETTVDFGTLIPQ